MSHYKVTRTGEVLDRATGHVYGTVRKDGKVWRAILPGHNHSIIKYFTKTGAVASLASIR